MEHMKMEMSFHWGNEYTILFNGWPNQSIGMYILALFFVFALAFVMEALSVWPTSKPTTNSMVAAFVQASAYAIRVSMGYLLMLAVMSFNVGILLAAVAGHVFGFFVVKASALALGRPSQQPGV